MGATIRPATMADYAAISQLANDLQAMHAEAYPLIFADSSAPILSEQRVGEIIADPTRRIAIAEMNGQIVGFAYVWIKIESGNEFEKPQRFMIIEMLSIDETYQGRGIGKSLMHHMHEWGAAQGATHAQLYVWSFNGRAQEFYETQGYESMLISMVRALR